MSSFIDQSGALVELSYWVNIYQSVGEFTGNVYTWSTGTQFESKDQAIRIGNQTLADDVKYIGSYKVTLKTL